MLSYSNQSFSGSQTKDEAFNQITSLTEKGDIMDATILSTKLLNKNSDLPPPLAPVHTPTHNNTPDGHTKDNHIVSFKDRVVLSKVCFDAFISVINCVD